MNTNQRITRLIELARAMRQKENAAAYAGDYLLAIVYNRAHLRAYMLATALHCRDYGGYRYTALNLNEFYAVRMPWTPETSRLAMITDMDRGGKN